MPCTYRLRRSRRIRALGFVHDGLGVLLGASYEYQGFVLVFEQVVEQCGDLLQVDVLAQGMRQVGF